MVKGGRKRTPAQSSIHTRSNGVNRANGLFSSPLKKEIKLESENNNCGKNPGTKTGRVKKSPPRITSYFTSPKANGLSENLIKEKEKEDIINNCKTPDNKKSFIENEKEEIVSGLEDTSPIRERFKTDETPVAVPCVDPPTPHRINMPNVQSDDSDTRSSTEEIEKQSKESATVEARSGKILPRGRPKLKYTVAPTNQATNGKANEPPPPCNNNHKLTEYFPVRRSVRKCKKTVLEEKQRDIENKVLCQVEDGLEIKHFAGKGRGIVTTREFLKGQYVVEYIGELIDQVTAKKREAEYAKDQNTGCYMYYFQHRGQQYCVDATAESDKLGRLVNHSRNGNLIARVIDIASTPHLVLTAKEDIPIGVEISYDYGDRSRESIRNHPWLAL